MASAGSYTLAVPSPLASVATPFTRSDAGCTGAPPQVLPAAPPMPICIGPAAHAGERGPPVIALHLADAGQDHPRNPVARPDGLEEGQVVLRDRVPRGRAGRRLPRQAGT